MRTAEEKQLKQLEKTDSEIRLFLLFFLLLLLLVVVFSMHFISIVK